MNALLKTSLLTLLLAMGLATSASAQTRIATVDLKKLFDGFWKTKESDAALKENAAGLDKEHKGLLDTYNKSMEEYKKLLSGASDQAVSTEERDKRKKAAEDKLIELKSLEENIKQFEAQARESLETQRGRMRDQVLKEIKEMIVATARAETYDLVLDTAGNSRDLTPIVVFTTGANDLTEKVLAKLNADAPKDQPPAREEKKDGGKKADSAK